MTTENKGTDQTTDNTQPTAPIITSLDAAAFEAATSKPAAANGADQGTPNVDKAIEGADKGEGADKKDGGDGNNEPSFKDLRSLNPDEINTLLAADDDNFKLPEKKAEGDDAAGKEGEAEGAADGGKKATPMIPKPRLDEALNKGKEKDEALTASEKRAQELEAQLAKEREEKAYYRGLAEGAKQNGAQPAAPAKDPLAEIDADLNTLEKDRLAAIKLAAKKFDDGEMKMEDFKEEEDKINRQASRLRGVILNKRQKVVEEQSKPAEPDIAAEEAAINADPRLAAATNTLMDKNPWLSHLPEPAVKMLTVLAAQEMQRLGQDPTQPTPEATWQLRQQMVNVGKSLGYDRITAGAAPATQPNGKANGGAQPTAEQRAAKLALAGQQPPAPNLGGTAAPTSTLDGINFDTVKVQDMAKDMPLAQIEQMLGER